MEDQTVGSLLERSADEIGDAAIRIGLLRRNQAGSLVELDPNALSRGAMFGV